MTEKEPERYTMERKEVIRAIKFALISASAGIVEIGLFTILNEFTGLRYWPCYLTALIASVLWNFTFNRSEVPEENE